MSRIRRAKQAAIHSDRLVPSHPSVVHGAFEVEERFLDLTHTYFRLKGEPLPIPGELDRAMLLWRGMRVRHRCRTAGCGGRAIVLVSERAICRGCGQATGDYRHTDSELRALKEFAQWTLKVNAEIRNQKVKEVEL